MFYGIQAAFSRKILVRIDETCAMVELSRQNRKAGVLFAMTTLTQTLTRRQVICEYALKHSISEASRRYNVSRPTIYRWLDRYDGNKNSLQDYSRKPHHHPTEHTADETKLIQDMRRRNPNDGLVYLWIKLRQRGYERTVYGLYKELRRQGDKRVKLPNPKKASITKEYEKMQYPGQRVQIDVKYVPKVCLVENDRADGGFYQYTFIDEYSRYRILGAYKEHNTYSSADFIKQCVKRFPYVIECVQTDNGFEFTNRLAPRGQQKKTLSCITSQ